MAQKILIVDDATVMRLMLKHLFQNNGFEVVAEAANGEEAVAMYAEHKPDLVTMDITMPEMDGVTCVKKLMERAPTTLILVISALADKATAIEAIKVGARGFLCKPFTKAELNDALQELVTDGA